QLARFRARCKSTNAQPLRTLDRATHVLDTQSQRANGSAMCRVVGAREALGLTVDHEVDGVLLPAHDILGTMTTRGREAEAREQGLELRHFGFVGSEL